MADSQASTVSQFSDSGAVQHADAIRHRATKTPPPPPSSSMTPPPSSQAPHVASIHSARKDSIRTPSPTHSHLTSPPPTVKTGAHNGAPLMQGQDQFFDMSVEELRERLNEATIATREAKASAAHLTLQYNLLYFEHNEAKKRMEVELDMTRKEVEVLRSQSSRNGNALISPVTPSPNALAASLNDQQLVVLRNRCTALEMENDDLRGKLQDVEAYWQDRDRDMMEENRRLRERIRDNRRHLNQIRQANGLPDASPSSIFATPRTTGRLSHAPPSSGPYSTNRSDDPLNALLLADKIMNEGTNTTPSTPTPYQSRRGPYGHHRGTHSLSSLPSTPVQARSVPQSSRGGLYQTPTMERTPLVPQTAPAGRHRRRESRDSTISAADVDDANVFDDDVSSAHDLEEISESRASQEAASLLRKSSSFSRNQSVQSSQRSLDVPRTSQMLQTKLQGKITKPGVSGGASKRKPSASPIASAGSPTKKGRGEGVGLGIGGWSQAR